MAMTINSAAFFSWLLAASVSFAILWVVYAGFFRSWTFFTVNRWIIIGGTCACLAFPWISSDVMHQVFAQKSPVNAVQLHIPHLQETRVANVSPGSSTTDMPGRIEWFWLVSMALYVAGVAWTASRSVKAFAQLRAVRSQSNLLSTRATANVWVQSRLPTFSFGKNIFLNVHTLSLPEDRQASILRHEEAHVLQHHSADNVFFEIVSAIFWFNPFVRKLSRHLRDVHEFLADQWAVGTKSEVNEYQHLLVSLAGASVHRVAHPFSDSQFFRRIIMLNKPKTNAMESLKLLLLVPACATAIFLSACVDSGDKASTNAPDAAVTPVSGPVISKITWAGNKLHSESELNQLLGAKLGDRYERQAFEASLFKEPLGKSVVGLYMNDGYLFFHTDVAEKRVGDQVELTINVTEGERVWVNNVILTAKGGNQSLIETVRPLVDVKKGQLFNRSLLINTQAKLAKSGFVHPDSVTVNPYPLAQANPGDRRYVDIEFIVQNAPTDGSR